MGAASRARGACSTHLPGAQRPPAWCSQPALPRHVVPGAAWSALVCARRGWSRRVVLAACDRPPLGTQGTEKAAGSAPSSPVMAHVPSGCRQTEEPLPAEAAPPARDAPRHRPASLHRGLPAPGRSLPGASAQQPSLCGAGRGGGRVRGAPTAGHVLRGAPSGGCPALGAGL